MAANDPLYSARFLRPMETIERSRDNLITCPIYRSGALVAPSGGTCTVTRPDGSTFVTGSVTITGSIATYNLLGSSLAAEAYGEGWSINWALTLASIVTTFRRDAAVVLRCLYPACTDADLYLRHSDLDPAATGSIAGTKTTWQNYLDEAWFGIESRLVNAEGKRPYLIMSPAAFREVHLYSTLELIFRDLSTTLSMDGKYASLSADYERKLATAWSQVTFAYDTYQQGINNDVNKRKSGQSTYWLGGGRPTNASSSPGTQGSGRWPR